MFGQISWNDRVGMVNCTKWCNSSMCSRLMGPHSGSDRGQGETARGGDGVDGCELLSTTWLDGAGPRRMHVSFRFTQFAHGSPSSH